MVISPTTAKIDPSKVPYLKGKSPEEVKKAAGVEQPSHAAMVTVVTGFIDKLINLEVGKLETAAKDNANPEAQNTAKGNLDKYNADQDSTVTPLVREVADDLAKHLFTVKELLVADKEASKREDGYTIVTKKGTQKLNSSTNALVNQTLKLVQARLSNYGIKLDSTNTAKLKNEIIQELKSPPKPKSAADTTASAATTDIASTATPPTTSTSLENPIIFLINFLKEKQSKLTKGLLGSNSIVTFLNQQADEKTGQKSGMSLLRKSNQDIKDKIANSNQDQIDSALQKFDTNLAENTKFIETHLGKNSFPNAFNQLTDDKKIQVGILLKNLEITVDEKTMVNLTGKITGQLGEKAKQNLETALENLINQQDTRKEPANPLARNLSNANKRLGEYNTALENIKKQHLPTQRAIEEKQKATDEFLENIKDDLSDNRLTIEDVKVIKASIELTEEQRSSGKASPVIDNILGRFINPLKEQCEKYGITTEDLKQFAGTTAALVIGAALFCPNLVPGLTNGVFRLAGMMTEKLIPLYNSMTQANTTENLARALAGKAQETH